MFSTISAIFVSIAETQPGGQWHPGRTFIALGLLSELGKVDGVFVTHGESFCKFINFCQFSFARTDDLGDGLGGEDEGGDHAIDIIASDRGGVDTAIIIPKRTKGFSVIPQEVNITKNPRFDLSSGVEILTIIVADDCRPPPGAERVLGGGGGEGSQRSGRGSRPSKQENDGDDITPGDEASKTQRMIFFFKTPPQKSPQVQCAPLRCVCCARQVQG
jgi:hypothetical protein